LTLVLDSSGVLAGLARSERAHRAVVSVLEESEPPLVLSPFVLAEVDYLLETRHGRDLELDFLSDVARGAYDLASFHGPDVSAALDLLHRYDTLGVGLADASVAVLAERYGTRRILTLDERRFRALRASDGSAFVLLPADA
jgi:predicted nucleic acid-binding protein